MLGIILSRVSSERPSIEAALGLRAHAGSREALLRAAFDLVDTQPGLRVHRRSLVWIVPVDPSGAPEQLAAAVAVRTQLRLEQLEVFVLQLQLRLSAPLLGAQPLLLDLLWAHDPSGKPSVVAVPPVGPGQPQRPPMPLGLTFLHPEVPLRASACGPLAEVADQARDPANTLFASEYLATVPPPLLERPQPFTPAFALDRRVLTGGRVDAIMAGSRADLLAAAAEALTFAPKAAEGIGPATLLPDAAADAQVSVTLPQGISLRDRLNHWLHAVGQVVVSKQLAVRRVVLLEDGPLAIHGVLFGARREAAAKLGRVRDIAASEDPIDAEYRAEIALLDP